MHQQPARICFVTPDYPPKPGGLAVAARRVVRLLAEAGHQVNVVTGVEPGHTTGAAGYAHEDGAILHRLPLHYGDVSSAFHFRQFIRDLDRKENFDLFHSFFISFLHVCTEVAKGRPVIASIRGGDEDGLTLSPFFLSQFAKALKKTTWVTSVNRAYLERLMDHVDLRGKSSVIRNGVACPPPAWKMEDSNRGVAGTAGQFRQEKDIPLLIRGYREVPPALRRKLLLVGSFADQREREWSETLIGEFGLAREVEITGNLVHAEALQRLRSMYVYVHSSSREGMPNALLEAAAAGVPVVATASEGVREILTDGEDALLVPHGNPRLLGEAIARVLSDSGLAARLSRASARLAARYSQARERTEWIELYQRLLSKVGVSAAV